MIHGDQAIHSQILVPSLKQRVRTHITHHLESILAEICCVAGLAHVKTLATANNQNEVLRLSRLSVSLALETEVSGDTSVAIS